MAYIAFLFPIIILTLLNSFKGYLKKFPIFLIFIIFFIPYQIGAFFWGGYSSFGAMPPFVYSIALFFFIVFFFKKNPAYIFKNNKLIIFLFAIMFIYSAFISYPVKQSIPISIFCNFTMPFLFYLFIIQNKKASIYKYKFKKILLYISVFLGCFALVEYAIKISPYDMFWATDIATENIFEDNYRIKTTIGHPLYTATAALILLVAMPLTNNKNLNKIAYIALWLVIVCSGSRTAFALAVLYSSYKMILSKNIANLLLFMLGFIFFGMAGYYLGFFDTIIGRFSNDLGSANVRLMLIENLWDIFFSKIYIFGLGLGASGSFFREEFGIPYIVENSFLHFYINLGIFGLALMMLMIFLILKRIGFSRKGIELSIVTFAMIFGYLSISNNTIIPLLFLIVFWLSNENVNNKPGVKHES